MSSRRFVDLQVFVEDRGQGPEERRRENHAAFATFEPVRLSIKERRISAPFRKLLIDLQGEHTARAMQGLAPIVDGVCRVVEFVELDVIRDKITDHRWVLSLIDRALHRVTLVHEWDCPELQQAIREMAANGFPLIHLFEGLAKLDRQTGARCVPWFDARPGLSRVGVIVGSREVVLLVKEGPLYLEDDFPLAKTAIRDRNFLVLDSRGGTLAGVPIDASDMETIRAFGPVAELPTAVVVNNRPRSGR